MRYQNFIFTILFSLLSFTIQAQVVPGKKDKRTPFDKVMYQQGKPLIQVSNVWVELRAIEGIPIEKYLKMSAEIRPTDWQKGFHRYLHYHFDDLGIERGSHVSVSYLKEGEVMQSQLALHNENREKATAFHNLQLKKKHVERQHNKVYSESYEYLNIRLDTFTAKGMDWLSPDETFADLDFLEYNIKEHYSYADLSGFDYEKAIDFIRQNIKSGISKRDFALQLKLFMANFGDGHSRVSISEVINEDERLNLPFRIVEHNDEYFAIDPESKNHFDPSHQKLVSIGGLSIKELVEFSSQLVAKTSPGFVHRNAVEYLHYLGFLLKAKGYDLKENVEVEFSNGIEKRKRTLKWGKFRYSRSRSSERLRDTILDGKIGYLSFTERMHDDPAFIDALHESMKSLKETDGLIIDIRGNGGGSRAPLLELLPYFINAPKVVNVARFRINEDEDFNPRNGYLESRYMFPLTYDENLLAKEDLFVSQEDFVEASNDFNLKFKPKIQVEEHRFSEYHYMVVAPRKDEAFMFYDKPVIVLIDEGCFSASDIFAAGLKVGEKVSLLGNTTGGGSGFSKSRLLPHSNIKVKLSRMFSYQPDGNLYDGQGVVPDIIHPYTLEDKMGITDSQLEKAISILNRKNRKLGHQGR